MARRKKNASTPGSMLAAAALVGVVLGFAGERALRGDGAAEPVLAAGAERDKDQDDLPANFLREKDLPPNLLTGLTEPQKYSVLKAMNEETCDCGCDFGSLANCRAKDPNCPNSPALFRKAIELAKQGKNSEEIKAGLDEPLQAAAPPPAPDPNVVHAVPLVTTAVVPKPPQKGPDDAKVTILEVSDFQCPFCSRAAGTIEALHEKYGDQIRIVFANNPLSFHAQAQGAAEAALAAHEQGKFWEMHDKLFANQKELSSEAYARFAQELGLDETRFSAAIESGKFKEQIAKEQALYLSKGARGTPAFFINGRFLSGAQPLETFAGLVDEELKKAEALLAKGVAPRELYERILAGAAP